MINKIQNSFSIKDLEVLTGIKAHTIRIWEKRYNILNPARLNRNIRVYSILDLQKILNVSLLLGYKYKISELSKFSEKELEQKTKSISLEKLSNNYHINSLIVSMFSYDDQLFEETYLNQSEVLSFTEIIIRTYLPLLTQIGILWQTNGVRPAQERFISNLIYQKVLLNIAETQEVQINSKQVNILFLPKGEVHELGLLFQVYRLKLSGRRTIYLGKDIPTEDLYSINSQFQNINWICCFVIGRTEEEKNEFVMVVDNLLEHNKNTCSVVGKIWSDYSSPKYKGRLTFLEGFDQLEIE